MAHWDRHRVCQARARSHGELDAAFDFDYITRAACRRVHGVCLTVPEQLAQLSTCAGVHGIAGFVQDVSPKCGAIRCEWHLGQGWKLVR